MTRPAEPQRIDLSFEELEAILDKAVRVPLTEEERDKLRSVVESLALLTEELAAERTSLARLRKFLFGAKKSEKTRDVCGEEQGADESSPGSGGAASNNSEKDPGDTDASADAGRGPAKKGPRGHGRNGANAYAGAEEIAVPHGELKVGDPCPECPEREGKNKGRLYALPPSRVVRFGSSVAVRSTPWSSRASGSAAASAARSSPRNFQDGLARRSTTKPRGR